MTVLDKNARRVRLSAILVLLLLGWAVPTANAYVGPGAGAGGSASIGLVGIAVLALAGLIVLSGICGVVVLIVTLARRLRPRSPDA